MSAVPQHIPHVRELFTKNKSAAVGVGSFENADQGECKSYDISAKKKRRAPAAPPTGLGQYKPKILSDRNVTNIAVNHGASRKDVHPSHSQMGLGADITVVPPANDNNRDATKNRPFIMGDKDTPMVLHSSDETNDLELGVSNLSLTSNRVSNEEGEIGTENPLFNLQATNGTVPSPNGDTNFEDIRVSLTRDNEPKGVFIPAPDYDEEEKTLVFSDEPDDEAFACSQQGKKVYKEYYGEDFSQYLSDEETDMDPLQTRPRRPNPQPDRKSKTEVKRHYKKREAVLGKGKAKDKVFSGSNSLRNFSFADSKFGTVNGSSKRLSTHSLSEDTGEAELFMNTGSSYEHFLRSKNGEELGDFVNESPLGDDRMDFPKAPSSYARSPTNKKDTLWKKLTWKFKKQAKNSFDLNTA